MAGENFSDVKAFLKRAADLESVIYSYEQTRALLRHTLEYDVSSEARTVKKYEYGDTIPWHHVMPQEERKVDIVYARYGTDIAQERKNYKKENKEYARYHSYDEWCKGHTPPDGYPAKKKKVVEGYNFTFGNFIASLIICGGIGVIIALLLGLFTDVSFKYGFVISTLVLEVLFWIITRPSFKGQSAEPTSEAYLLQKANYEQEVNARNAILSKELGVEAYCIKAEQELAPVEAKVREELKNHYAKGLLHPKYQNFLAVTQIYEYFDTKRCSTLEGANGAYNLFEAELRANTIINQLSQVIQKLDEIKQAMYELVSAIERTNGLLGEISQDIRRVENAINVNTTAINEFNAATIYTLNRI